MDNSLQQYIELFDKQRATIDANAPEALNRRRREAADVLRRAGRLPRRGDEGFEKISLNDMFAPDYGINIARICFKAESPAEFGCDVPGVGVYAAMVVNDAFEPVGDLASRLPEGVEMMSLADAARMYPDLAYARVADLENPIVALNTMFVQDGVFIRVRRGVRLEKPLQVLSLFNTSMPLMSARRVFVVVEDGAAATVLMCDHPRVQTVDYLNCRVVEAVVGNNASLDFYDLEESTPRSRRASVFAATQAEGSHLNVCSIYLNGSMTRNEFYPLHLGEHCTTRLGGLAICGGKQIIDNATYVIHKYPRCTSEQLFKYAIFDSAQGAFEGLVTVEPGAEFTEARQTNRNLLASSDARMHTMPQLIINCDEVKASHGAATGRLDEDALFYMRSRGIPEAEARMMLVNAFMTDVLDAITLEPLRERLRHLVDKRLRGCGSKCSTCPVK